MTRFVKPPPTLLTVFLAASLFLVLSGCGGGGGTSGGDSEPLPRKTVSWSEVTTFTDSSNIPVGVLEGYRIYVNETGAFTNNDTPKAAVGPTTTEYDLNLIPGLRRGIVYHVRIRAVVFTDNIHALSDFSPDATFSF